MLQFIGRTLARFLSRPIDTHGPGATCTPELLERALRKGDVLLVEGNTRISQAIKYLTQSSWSHAALYIGDVLDNPATPESPSKVLLEVDINEGVRAVPVQNYWQAHTRICRPVGLIDHEIDAVIDHAISRLGQKYDLKNITDLARYLIPTPPLPVRWRRRALSLGSGQPTQAICSSLIAEAFHSIPYPILPIASRGKDDAQGRYSIRHPSLFAPRDFDVSPYFDIIKPTLKQGFDPHSFQWESTP